MYAQSIDSKFHIEANKIKSLVKDLQLILDEEETDIEMLLNIYSWEPSFDEMGNIVDIFFERQKYFKIDDEIMKTIAPYVSNNNYITMIDENKNVWKYSFLDKKVHKIQCNGESQNGI